MDSTTSYTSGPGRRERKKLETRQALTLAAVQLARERGLEKVRVEDITDAVNVSRRTFTNYFSCKEEAIASRSADRFADAIRALRDRPADEPLADSLAEVFAAQHEVAAQFRPERIALIRMMMTSPVMQGEALKAMVATEGPLATVIAERTGTDPQRDLHSRVLAAAVVAAVRAATQHWLTDSASLPDLIRQAVRQVAAPPPGIAQAPGASHRDEKLQRRTARGLSGRSNRRVLRGSACPETVRTQGAAGGVPGLAVLAATRRISALRRFYRRMHMETLREAVNLRIAGAGSDAGRAAGACVVGEADGTQPAVGCHGSQQPAVTAMGVRGAPDPVRPGSGHTNLVGRRWLCWRRHNRRRRRGTRQT
jgi:AcrR family transcriptional regulator